MLLDLIGRGRVLYAPVGGELGFNALPKLQVKDGEPTAIYVNAFIADGSRIGPNSFIIACAVGDDVSIGSHCHIHNSRVGNNVSIESYSSAGDRNFFGDNVALADGVRIGSYCGFGSYLSIGSYSFFGEYCGFGDNTHIKEHNTFGNSCKFGRGTSIGRANIFHTHPTFANMPILAEAKALSDESIHVFALRSSDKVESDAETLRDRLKEHPGIWQH